MFYSRRSRVESVARARGVEVDAPEPKRITTRFRVVAGKVASTKRRHQMLIGVIITFLAPIIVSSNPAATISEIVKHRQNCDKGIDKNGSIVTISNPARSANGIFMRRLWCSE